MLQYLENHSILLCWENILIFALLFYGQEVVKKICSWQYINCIDLWVTFISANIQDYDLQPLLYMSVQIINGVALLFPGPRYLPLRLRCIQWLNHLACSSGVFIPVTSLVLDVLEYKITKDGGKPGKVFEPLSSVKVRDEYNRAIFSENINFKRAFLLYIYIYYLLAS